jgi:MYXO-CTERM domain-containing protein
MARETPMTARARRFVLPLLLLALLAPASAQAFETLIQGNTTSGPNNCIPFGGGSSYAPFYSGFVYQNIPAFELGVGDTIAFDLGAQNDVNIQVDVSFATAESNGSWEPNAAGFTDIVTYATPADPNGNGTLLDYELQFTATSAFSFPGGGLIVRIKPRNAYASDSSCTGVLVHSSASDSSNMFVGRFYSDADGQYPWSGSGSTTIGVLKITWTGNSNTPPTANSDTVTTDEDTPIGIGLTGGDADGDPITYAVTSGPSHGALTGSAPSLTYTPDPNWNGTDTFDFVTNDGSTDSTPATITIVVDPVNDPPVASDTSGSTDEDLPVVIPLLGSDVESSPLTWTLDGGPGNGGVAIAGANATYTPDPGWNGTDTFTVVANDGSLDSNVATVSVEVAAINDPPTANGQALATVEDTPIAITLTGSAPDGDPLGYTIVAFPSNGALAGTPPTLVYTPNPDFAGADSFEFIVNDGSVDSSPAVVTIDVADVNDPPVAMAGGPYAVDEGSAPTLDGSGSYDADGAVTTWAWDCESDGVTDGGGSIFGGCTYADEGAYLVTLEVTDDVGLTASAVAMVTVANVAPTLSNLAGDVAGAEGDSLAWAAAATDPGPADVLTFVWDFGDGSSPAFGDLATHVFDDDGTFTVQATASDGDGGTDSDTITVTIANIAPEIISTPPGTALEGIELVYQAIAVEPGDDTLVWTLNSGPAGMLIEPTTGLLTWTPTTDQSIVGVAAADISVSDGDGGTDQQIWGLTIEVADSDGDGLADSWETDNGLDPTDPTDALTDPDGDGLSNLDEAAGGTDPFSFDGPSAPTLLDPTGGETVTLGTPTLLVANASDPQGDPLTYDFEVYADAGLTSIVAAGTLAEDGSGQTGWAPAAPLDENGSFHWRARAADPLAAGPWSDVETFVVDAVGEAPGVPTPTYPIDGETVAIGEPYLEWVGYDDPEGTPVTFEVQLWNATQDTLVTSAAGIVASRDVTVDWTIDVALDEDSLFHWEVRAVDGDGTASDWSALEPFVYSFGDAAPEGVVFVDPMDGDVVEELSPVLVAQEAIDPEGELVVYLFEIDLVDTFDSGDLEVSEPIPGTNAGTVWWDLAEDGVELPEQVEVFARVRAEDPAGGLSGWDTISFVVRGPNDAPAIPLLLAPEDGVALEDGLPTLVAAHVEDPEGDAVRYDFVIATDAELTDVVVQGWDVAPSAGDAGDVDRTSWSLALDLDAGAWYWSARAVDELGAESDWAAAWSFTVPEPPTGDDDDDDGGAGGCDCGASMAGSSSGGLLALALLALAPLLRRRRR